MSSPLKQNTTTIQELLNTINALPEAGTDLPELNNEGSATDLLSGKQLIDSDGNKVTGTFSIDSELSEQDSLIEQIIAAADSLPEAGGGGSSGDNSFPYTVTVNTNIGNPTLSLFYNNDNMEVLVVIRTALGTGLSEVIGGELDFTDATESYSYYHITSIIGDVTLSISYGDDF